MDWIGSDEFLEGEELEQALAEIEEELAQETKYWQEAKLPPAGLIYQLGPQQFEHHCHGETFLRLFMMMGLTEDQVNLVYRQTVLKELRGLRKVAKEAQREALRHAIVDGVNVVKPPPRMDIP